MGGNPLNDGTSSVAALAAPARLLLELNATNPPAMILPPSPSRKLDAADPNGANANRFDEFMPIWGTRRARHCGDGDEDRVTSLECASTCDRELVRKVAIAKLPLQSLPAIELRVICSIIQALDLPCAMCIIRESSLRNLKNAFPGSKE